MKKFFAILAALAVSALIFTVDAKQPAKAVKKEVVYQTNMDCAKCEKKIIENISFEKGVLDLKTTLEDKKVRIVYNSAKTDTEKLAAAIRKLGYTAEIVEEKTL